MRDAARKLLRATRVLLGGTLSLLTGAPRHFPAPEWSGGRLLVHDAFRLWELVAGRPMTRGAGDVWSSIRCESVAEAWVDESGTTRVVRQFFTAEAVLAHFEGTLRGALGELPGRVRRAWHRSGLRGVIDGIGQSFDRMSGFGVMTPAFAAGAPFDLPRLGPYRLAIAFDAASDGTTTGTSLNVSQTCAGANRFILAAVGSYTAGDVITGVTFNGDALAKRGTATPQANTRNYLWDRLAPAATTANVTVSASGSTTINCAVASYTGVQQSGLPDSSATGNGSGTTITATTTVVGSTCWIFASMYGGSGNLAASTNTTQRGSTSVRTGIFDSNAIVAAGSRSLVATCSNDNWGYAIESQASAAAYTGGNFFLLF